MKAVVCHQIGQLADLVIEEQELPPVGAQDVKVALRAAAVNFPDVLMVQGKYQFQPPLPFSPGLEGAGEVIEVGKAVTDIQVGDRVMTHHRYGGFAEEILVPPHALRPLPLTLSPAEGAAFRVAYNTAYVALVCRAQLQPGEILLVHGASGGVGLAAVELGKLLGATVIGTASCDEKLAVVRNKQADYGVNYSKGFREQILELTDGRGADVIYDPVGGGVFEESTRCIAWGGRLLVIGFAGGRMGQIRSNIPLIKGFSIVGVRAGEFGRRNPQAAQENENTLMAWAAEGKLKPRVSQIFSLEQAVAALELLANRQAVGKVVLTMQG